MKKIIVLLSFLAVFTSFGYIVKFEKWQKDGKSVYLLADVHIKTPLAKTQQEDLIAAATKCQDAILLAEDSFNLDPVWYRGVYHHVECIKDKIAKTIHDMEGERAQSNQFLAYITRLFEKNGLKAYNAEIRHIYRVWPEDQAQLLHAMREYLKNSGEQCLDEVAIKQWYLNTFFDAEKSISDQFRILLDAYLVMLTKKALKESNNVFVAAGFQHILPVQDYLKMLGFEKGSETGKDEDEASALYEQSHYNDEEFVASLVRPIDIIGQFGMQRIEDEGVAASSSSYSDVYSGLLASENTQNFNHRLLEYDEKSKGLSIRDLLKSDKCPKIYESQGKRRLALRGFGLTSLEGLKDVPGIQLVQHIDLSKNYICALQYSDFQAMSKLEKINLDNNFIKTIAPFCFASMLNLVSLDLRNNRLGEDGLDVDSFTGPNITRLYLSDNGLKDLPEGLNIKFKEGHEVFIDLRQNKFRSLPSKKLLLMHRPSLELSIKQDVSIEQLLSDGQIQLEQVGDLVMLSLKGKGLTSLQGFKDIPGIETVGIIDLSDNKLNAISKDDFPAIADLKVLDLSGNILTSIPEQCFASFGHIEMLNICGNKIVRLYQNSFNGPTIGKLWLSQNYLSTLPDKMSLRMLSKGAQKRCEVMLTQNKFENDPALLLSVKDMDEKVLSRIYVDEKLKTVIFKNGLQTVNITTKDGSVLELKLEDLLQFDWLKDLLSSKNFNAERFLQLSKNMVQRSPDEEDEYNYGYTYLKETLPLMFNEQSVLGLMDKEFLEFFFKVLKVSRNTPSDIEFLLQDATPAALVDMCYYADYFCIERLKEVCVQVAAQRLSEIAEVESVDNKLHTLLKNNIVSRLNLPCKRPVKFNFAGSDNKFKFYKNYILHWQNIPEYSFYNHLWGQHERVPSRVVASVFERSSCALVDRFEVSSNTQELQLSPDGKNIIIDDFRIVSPLKKSLDLGEQNEDISFKKNGNLCLIGSYIALDLARKTMKLGNNEERITELDRGEIERVDWHKDHNMLQIVLKGGGHLLYSFDTKASYNHPEQSFKQIAQRLDGAECLSGSDSDDSSVAASST